MSNGSDFALNFFLWMLVPNSLTTFLQARYYAWFWGRGFAASKVSPRAAPRPGSDAFMFHHRVIYSLVVGSYLAYCIANVFWSVSPNYYADFGMNRRSFTPKELRSRYKAATLLYHPDKDPSAAAAVKFSRIKTRYEALNDADKRAIYESFGGDMECVNCTTFRQYVWAFVPESLMFWGVSGVVLIILGICGRRDYAQSIRFMTLLLFAAAELWLVFDAGRAAASRPAANATIRADSSAAAALFETLFGAYTAHQRVKMLREFSVYFFIFLSQICPVWFPDVQARATEAFDRAQNLAELLTKDVTEQATNAFEPFTASPETTQRLKRAIEKTAIELKLFEKDESFRKKYIAALTRKK